MLKELTERIDSDLLEDSIEIEVPETETINMNASIDEGNDHIKDLELKIKTQGMGQNIHILNYPTVFLNA